MSTIAAISTESLQTQAFDAHSSAPNKQVTRNSTADLSTQSKKDTSTLEAQVQEEKTLPVAELEETKAEKSSQVRPNPSISPLIRPYLAIFGRLLDQSAF